MMNRIMLTAATAVGALALLPTAAQANYSLTGRSSASAGYQYSNGSSSCNYGITQAGGACNDFHGGDGSNSSATINPIGGDGTATFLSAATSAAGGGASGSSQVTADLKTASAHVLAASSNAAPTDTIGVVTGSAQSDVTMNDVLHFSIPGASATTVTQIGVTFTLAGNISAPGYRDPSYSPIGEVYGGMTFGSVPSDFYLVNSAATGYVTMATLNNYPSSHDDTWTTNASHTLNVSSFTYDLVGASVDVPFYLFITAQCRYGAVCDFDAVKLGLNLPSGVSYTSDSGGFMSGGGGVASVPEPTSWAMLIAGFGIVGASARRRRNSATTVAVAA